MSIDRLLTTVLGLYQDVHDAPQTDRILGSTTTLLAGLHNPLNLSLLTSQFLAAPAIWRRPDGLRTCMRVISIYHTAAVHVQRNERDKARGALPSEAWARAVIGGADDRSARWQHLLVLTGVLMGLEGNNRRGLSGKTRATLEQGLVAAANLALAADARQDTLPSLAVVLALNYAFPLLSDGARATVDCDTLLPLAARAMTGPEGFHGGAILDAINLESSVANKKLHWSSMARSFAELQLLDSKPLVSAAGPLSKLLAYAAQHARDPRALLDLQDLLCSFSGELAERWSASAKLSGFDLSLEAAFLSSETAQKTWPLLWQFLKKMLYATVLVLQAVVARSLVDAHLRRIDTELSIPIKSLQILRDMDFVASHGANAFQVYTFVYLTSIDSLVSHQQASISFLRAIHPGGPRDTPGDASRLGRELFYLNLAEHFAMALPPDECDRLIVQPAMPYVLPTGSAVVSSPASPRMVEVFEAAHSAVLSVLSCPHNSPIAIGLAPVYAEALFTSFPSRISARQFRLAFKTMIQVLSPPFPVSATHPRLAETLLEMVRMRIPHAGTALLVPASVPGEADQAASPGPVSEQSALVLTMIDALPFLTLDILEEWMTTTAEAVWAVADAGLREVTKKRFWEVLISGEMDVERAAIGVAWWGTKGGGQLVLFGNPAPSHAPYLMSGAIVEGPGSSRL